MQVLRQWLNLDPRAAKALVDRGRGAVLVAELDGAALLRDRLAEVGAQATIHCRDGDR